MTTKYMEEFMEENYKKIRSFTKDYDKDNNNKINTSYLEEILNKASSQIGGNGKFSQIELKEAFKFIDPGNTGTFTEDQLIEYLKANIK